jgi:ABC-type Fe3+-hydroxamate transport system substrate-binding protein
VGPHFPRHVRLRLVRGRLIAAALASAVFLVSGCRAKQTEGGRSTSSPDAVSVLDAEGHEVLLPHPARRVVSLVPSATQTLRALGAGDVVVGRTDYDTAAWIASRPSVGGGLEPNLEDIVALKPDLVVRFAGSQDPHTAARLDELGIPQLAVRPDHVEDIYRTAEMLGAATDFQHAADSLVAWIRDGLSAATKRAATLPRVRFAYVLGGTPPWVSGPGTYIDQVISMVGGDNVFSDLDALYSAVSPEELLTRRIQVVLVPSLSAFDSSLAPGARVAVVGGVLEIPGPGVVDAAYHVANLLHGRSLR